MTTGTRCPDCGSMVRPDSSWCSLCHADLRSEEERAAARPPVPSWAEELVPETPVWASTAAPPVAPEVAPATAPTAEPARDVADGSAHRGRHARPAAETGAVSTLPSTLASTLPSTVQSTVEPSEQSPVEPARVPVAIGSDADSALAKAGVDVEAMMSLLAADQSKPLTPLSSRLSSKGNRAIAVLVAVAVLTAGGILLMSVLGLFLH